MFSKSTVIENSVKVMNSIEEGKFALLLNRIAQYLSDGTSTKPFTPVEEEKLENSLEITKPEVQLVVNGIIEIFQICAYFSIKPTLLSEQLEKCLPLNPKRIEIFVQVWTTFARGIVNNLKQKTYFPQLNHISYSLSVEAASDDTSKEKTPKAQLQFGLMSVNKGKDLNLEFNHKELYEFYKKLEQIQGQLDSFR